MRRRLYVDPESGSLEDCSANPDSWDSSFCRVLHGNDELWQRYLEAEAACAEARRAVLDAATCESMTAEEEALHEQMTALHALHDLDSEEWMRRSDEIEESARQLAERSA